MALPINILYFHNKSEISGGERSLLNLWENLDSNRFNIIVLLPKEGAFSKEAKKLNIRTYYVNLSGFNIVNILKVFNVLIETCKIIKNENINIIHSYSPRNNMISSIAGRLFNAPVIWHERNLIFTDERDLTKKYLSFPDAVICNSQAISERFLIKGGPPKKVRVILNGVNLKKFNPDIGCASIKKEFGLEDKKVIGLISNLNKRKRAGYFLTIASIVRKQYPEARFVIAGGKFSDDDNKYYERLKEKAVALNIDDIVIFTGFRNDVEKVISSFDVSVHVTLKEACSRAILESMACGKPVVAVNDGGNPELIINDETGFLIENDEDALVNFSDKIIKLLNDDELRQKMGYNARKRAEKFFDIRSNTEKTEALYLELLDKKQ